MGIRKIIDLNQLLEADFATPNPAHDLRKSCAGPVGNFIPNFTHK